MNDEIESAARYAGYIDLQKLKRAAKAGNVMHGAALYVEDDGIRVTIPVYDPAKNETMVRILMTKDGRFRVFRSLQAAKNAMHKCGITHYSIVRDGVECWT